MSWPNKGRAPSPASMAALTLSLLVHLALLSSPAVRGGQGGDGPAGAAAPVAPAVLSVHLLATPQHGRTLVPPPEPVAAVQPAAAAQAVAEELLAQPEALAAPTPVQEAVVPADAVEAAAGPVVTSAATVAEGLRGPALLLVPGVSIGKLTVHFWIDEHGEPERVELLKHRYSDSDAEQVQAALLKLRFHPARAGQVAVRSEMLLDLTVANAASF